MCKSISILFLSALVSSASLDAETPRSWTDKKAFYENLLETAEILKVEDIGSGVTNPRKVTLEKDGTVFHGVYKPLKRGRHKGYWESYQAEVAAYELDKMIGLDMVPPTIVRRVESDLGSLQLWVEGCRLYKEVEASVPRTPRLSHQVSLMKIFDNLIHNDDRNAGNFMLDEAWNIVLIDHSRAFIDREDLLKPETKLPVQFERGLVERLRALSLEELREKLGDLLFEGQVEAILERRDKLLEYMNELVEKNGEARVFFVLP